jgi:hypothetical protein
VLSSKVHVEHLGRVGHDVGRLGDRRLDTGVRHPSFHRGKVLAAEEQPRRGIRIAGEGLGIGNRSAVELEICRTLELSHQHSVLAQARREAGKAGPARCSLLDFRQA